MNGSDQKPEAQIASEVWAKYRRYLSYAQPRIERWKKDYRIVQFYQDQGSYGYRYNTSKPISFLYVENYTSSVVNAMFAQPDLVEILPLEGFNQVRNDIDDFRLAKQLNRAINHFFSHPDTGFRRDFRSFVKSTAYYGTAIGQLIPRQGKGSDGYPFLGPKFKPLQIYDVIPNPYFDHLVPGTDLFIREIVTPAELRRREKVQNYKNTEKAVTQAQSLDHGEDIKRENWQATRQGGAGTSAESDQRILLVHYFAPDGSIKIIAGQDVLVFDSMDQKPIRLMDGNEITVPNVPFEYYPFESASMNAGPDEFYGIGIARLTEQIQEHMNIRSSQRLENIELAIMKSFIISTFSGIDPDNLVMAPGSLILTNQMDGIREIEVSDVTRSSYMEDDVEFRLGEEVTGVQPALRGATGGSKQTATQASQQLQQAHLRGNTLMSDLADTIASLARKTAVMIRQFMNQHEYERIIGEPDAGLFRLSTREILECADFRPTWKQGNQNKEMRLQGLMQLLQVGANIPIVNVPALVHDIFKEFFPNVDPNKYISPVPMVAAPPPGSPPPGQAAPSGQPGDMPGTPGQGVRPPSRMRTPATANGNYKSANPAQTSHNLMTKGNA